MIDGTEVRLAAPRHAGAIALMARDQIEHGLGWSWTPARVGRALRDPEVNVAVVTDAADEVLAFGVMQYLERHAHLSLLAVRPECRRRGLALRIVGWLEASARAAGAERIVLECRRSNDAARCLYAELGYHETGIVPGLYRGREDGIRLEKWLRDA